jgi:F-type H+-transporting ATPase subunit delta
MASHAKVAQKFARQLFGMSVVDGVVSADRVAGVLEYVERHNVANPVMVLKAYERLVSIELAKGVAVVEHAGAISAATLASIEAAMSAKYGRTVKARAEANPALLAGMRVHVGDDTYESSVAGQLASLAASV